MKKNAKQWMKKNACKARNLAVAGAALGMSAVASATPLNPGTEITTAATTAGSVFEAFATLSISAFVLAMAIGYARKGKK